MHAAWKLDLLYNKVAWLGKQGTFQFNEKKRNTNWWWNQQTPNKKEQKKTQDNDYGKINRKRKKLGR